MAQERLWKQLKILYSARSPLSFPLGNDLREGKIKCSNGLIPFSIYYYLKVLDIIRGRLENFISFHMRAKSHFYAIEDASCRLPGKIHLVWKNHPWMVIGLAWRGIQVGRWQPDRKDRTTTTKVYQTYNGVYSNNQRDTNMG